ncbi:hypothetical protein FHX49_002093 [Microbacterium endophyticum]|uniref:2-oxoglutarate dehydrogenase n=1 Tax=Microbacterium endophyticum TaxID=1526412 RepID=A0A7W4V5C2_9MICO|nr:DUF6049 family protein [Microbacterium endophyticum]MBB2976518.1 hypothetical protein [Microbacterium endophyticum]NIK35964.1 hypothetical protein [Microbacterium endophyticum]
MTEILPLPGTPAPRRRARIFAVLAAALLAASSMLTALPAEASESTPSPTPSGLSGEIDVQLAPVSNGVIAAGDALTVWANVSNGTNSDLTDATVTLSIGSAPISKSDELSQWLAGGDSSGDFTVVDTASANIPSGESNAIVVTKPGSDPLIADRAAGVYPIRVAVETASDSTVSTSVITITDETSSASPVAVVVPITATASSGGLLSSSELTTLTGRNGALTAQLDAVDGTAAILAIDPAVLASIRVLGASAPSSASAWLDRLDLLPNDRFALQFADADVAVQADAGLTSLLSPLDLTAYMDAADFENEPEPTATASPTESPSGTPAADSTDLNTTDTDTDTDTAVPDLAALTDIGATHSNILWPASGSVDSATVASLVSLTGDEDTVTLVSSASTDEPDTSARATVDGSDVLVYNSEVSDALTDAARTDDLTLRGAPLSAATAYLSLAQNAAAGQPVLVVLDRDLSRSAAGLEAAVDAVTDAPATSSISLDALLAQTPQEQTLNEVSAGDARVAAVNAMQQEETQIAQFATILDDAVLLTGPQRASELQVLSVGLIADEGWRARFDAHHEQTLTTLTSVSILPPSNINLLTSGAGLGFWVKNDLPYPVSVSLYAEPDDLRLEVEPVTTVEAEPASNTRAEIPVQARIASGEVTIALRLESPTGVHIGSTESVDVNVRAEWEGIGVVVLIALIGGLLVVGIIRTVLRRRAKSAAPKEPAPKESAQKESALTSDEDSAQ